MGFTIKCNICGAELTELDMLQNFTITKKIGFGSEYDGEYLEMHICSGCMDSLINSCKVSPIEE